MDINEVATLLHVEEKLRGHGEKYKHMLAAIRKKLDEAEAQDTPKEDKPKEPKEDASKEAPKKDEAKGPSTHSSPYSSQTSSTITERRA